MITTALFSLCLLPVFDDSAKQAFLDAMGGYGKLDSISVELQHDNSSGLFSGQYHQQLVFKKDKGFKLVVTGIKGADRPSNVAPDYYCDGVDVTTKGRMDGVRPINKDPNTMPGYEVSGGLIMTWLLDSHTKSYFSKPPEGMGISMSWGKRTTWHEEKVVEVVMTMKMGTEVSEMNLFLDSDKKRFVGNEWTRDGKTGWMMYKNQKDNPKVNVADFKPPIK